MSRILTLFTAPTCPHCPAVDRMVTRLTEADPDIDLRRVDVAKNESLAAEYGVQAVPTLILDTGERFTGQVSEAEIRDALVAKPLSRQSPESLERMITDGNASGLAAEMLSAGQIFPAFYELLINAHWSIRLGAMVTVEHLAEGSSRLARSMVPELVARLDAVRDVGVQGDLIAALGMLVDESVPEDRLAYDRLTTLCADSKADPELREAAAEALEAMRERRGGS